jgi:septum formation protein
MNIYLASKSPRRKELLINLGFNVSILPSDINESIRKGETDRDYLKRIVSAKANKALLKIGHIRANELLISADTIVVKNNKIYLKPRNKKEAKSMLLDFSNSNHFVKTAFQIISNKKIYYKTISTKVFFGLVDFESLEEYLSKDEWHDKSGAYAIQGFARRWIKKINGSYDNVVGLPSADIFRLIKKITDQALGHDAQP